MFGKKEESKGKEVSYGIGYIGNIKKKPVLEQDFIDEENYAVSYINTGSTGTLRVYPYIVLTDNHAMFLLGYITNGIKELTHVKFNINNERRTIFTKRNKFNVKAERYATYAVSENFDTEQHKFERGYLTLDEVNFLKGVVKDKKATIEFHGDEIAVFNVGEYERKCIEKMISEFEMYQEDGFIFSNGNY